jgi:hypothetical protein
MVVLQMFRSLGLANDAPKSGNVGSQTSNGSWCWVRFLWGLHCCFADDIRLVPGFIDFQLERGDCLTLAPRQLLMVCAFSSRVPLGYFCAYRFRWNICQSLHKTEISSTSHKTIVLAHRGRYKRIFYTGAVVLYLSGGGLTRHTANLGSDILLVVYLASKVFIWRVLKVLSPRHWAMSFVVHPRANNPI